MSEIVPQRQCYSSPSNAKPLLGLFCNSNYILHCSHITLSSSKNVNIVEWLVSMPAVRLFLVLLSPLPIAKLAEVTVAPVSV